MKEVWKKVVGYEELAFYQVSNKGNIRSIDRMIDTVEGKRFRTGKNKKSYPNKKGYLQINVKINGVSRTFRVHRLVAYAFIENPLNKPQVNHMNCKKNDNRVENLEWCTNSENMQHALNNNLFKTHGHDSWNAKFTKEEILHIRAMYNNKEILSKECGYRVTDKVIADIYENHSIKINAIGRRRIYKNS